MKINEYAQMMSWLTRPARQEPRTMAQGGRIGFDLGGLADKLHPKQKEWYKMWNLQGGTSIRQAKPGKGGAGGPVITIDSLMKEKEIMDFLDDKIAKGEIKSNKYLKHIAKDNNFDFQRFERVLKRHYPQTFVYKGMKYKNLPQATIDKIVSLSKEDKSIKQIVNELSDDLPELGEPDPKATKPATESQKNLRRIRSIQKMLKSLGEKPIRVGRSTPISIEEQARRDKIIKDFFEKNPGAKESADSLAKKIPVTADYIKQALTKRNLIPDVKLIQRDYDIFPEVKAMDKIIKNNKDVITGKGNVASKINKIIREFTDATGKSLPEATSTFFARTRRLGDLYAGNKPKVKLYEQIKPPINYDDNFKKHFIQLISRGGKGTAAGGLTNVQMASLLGLPEKEIRLIGDTATMMKGFGKEFQMRGDHTDIKSMMQNFDDYQNDFSRIEYIKGNLNAYKGIFDKKIKDLSVEAETANPTRQAEILKEQAALRKEFIDKTGYRIGEFGIEGGRVVINPQTMRLPDLMNPMNKTLQQAMINLETTQVPPDYVVQKGSKPGNLGRILHTPKEVYNKLDKAFMNAKTVEERLKLFEYANKNPEIAKTSKYLNVLSKAPKVGKIAKAIIGGTAVVGGTMGMASLANASETGVVDKAKSWPIENPWLTGTGAAAASKFIKGDPLKYGRKIPRKILSSLATPTGALAAWPLAAMGIEKMTGEETPAFNPKSGIDRAAAGAELAFAPSLVKWTDKLTKPIKNPAVRTKVGQLLNLGMKPAMAMRIARLASPIGWASLGLEGLYQGGKFMYKDYQRRKADIEAAKADPNYVDPKYDTNFEVYAGGGIASLMKKK